MFEKLPIRWNARATMVYKMGKYRFSIRSSILAIFAGSPSLIILESRVRGKEGVVIKNVGERFCRILFQNFLFFRKTSSSTVLPNRATRTSIFIFFSSVHCLEISLASRFKHTELLLYFEHVAR